MSSFITRAATGLLGSLLLGRAAALVDVGGLQCRCLPGEDCWPAEDAWTSFNSTVEGRLISNTPIGSPCHEPNYDEVACMELQSTWMDAQTHITSPSSFLQIYFANQSCDAFTPQDSPCLQGNYPVYSVDVGSAEHAAATVRFANDNDIRLIIKNTGHDYFGRSSGAGSLSIWTHNLKSIEVLDDYSTSFYSGPAVKAGAGVLGSDLLEALDPYGLAVVSGECPSVGLAGGYIQGGGHSLLSTAFGLAADQALEYEVVTAAGEMVRAAPDENEDLYWALSGGGGGTYGVVTSVTVRAHAVDTVGGVKIQFLGASTTPETFGALVAKLHEELPGMVDQGATVTYILTKQLFSVGPITVVNSTGEHVRDNIAAPLISAIREANVPAAVDVTTMSYRDHFDKYLGPLPWGTLSTSEWQIGGRLIGRADIEDNADEISSLLSGFVQSGVTLAGTAGDFTAGDLGSVSDNAVNPRWRGTLSQLQLLTPWSTDPSKLGSMIEQQHLMTEQYVAKLKEATPNGGTYLNEADFREEDWKNEFFGGNYPELLQKKKKWDPTGLFYGLKTVGSDDWEVDAGGRMCRVL